jgi:release factor glutamine methyltransferase
VTETAREALARVRDRLASARCDTPRVDAELLLAHVFGTTRSAVLADGDRVLKANEAAELAGLTERRAKREPLAYVLGEWGFRGLVLSVDPRVLVPRPETEIVVERCLALIAGMAEPRVLDVGVGSGAIALAIADEHPGARVTGVDLSPGALEVARANAARSGLAVELGIGDVAFGLPPGPWDLVVSNPPYVQPEEIEALSPEVRDWEPRTALVADRATEAVVEGARDVLEPGGALVLEVAAGDARRVAGLLRELGYAAVTVTNDLTGRERVVEGMVEA